MHHTHATHVPSSATLIATDVSKSFGALPVLTDVSVRVRPGSRLGVVGPNGVGKTTLLQILGGLVAPDRGAVSAIPPSLNVGYLPQETDACPGEQLLDYLARRTGIAHAASEVERLAHALETDLGALDDYSEALDRLSALGADDFDARAAVVCDRLGLRAGSGRELMTLSGGERARAALAGVLLARFDVLLLDEPTNNLDFGGLDLLEQFLGSSPQGVVVVSHDRAFLERVVSEVLELHDGTHRSSLHAGGWRDYLIARESEQRRAVEAYERYAGERARLEQRASAQRLWAEAGTRRAKKRPDDADKGIRAGRVAGAESMARKAKTIERRIARLDPAPKPWEGWRLELTLSPRRRGSDVVVAMERAVVRHAGFTLGPVDLEVVSAERLALVGRNGSGKTTLLDALLGRVPLAAGRRRVGRATVFGAMEQHRDAFTTTQQTLDVFCRAAGTVPEEARTLLAKFGLASEHVLREAASLSPGERTRAVLALLAATGANCLVLDEPTNHLDLPAIEQLESALERFDGTIVVVSHDRRFLEALRPTRTITLGPPR